MLGEALVVDPKRARIGRLRTSVREAAKLHEQAADWASHRLGRSAYRKTFITLTYRDGDDWQRRHISEFVKNLRQWMARRGGRCLYVWVAETQKRGALHYHVLVWVPRRLRLPRPDACGWWPYGMSNIETARNPVGYMVKYATKTTPADLKRLKKGVRLHGNGGHDPVNRVALRQTMAPWWLKQADDARHVAAWYAEEERREERARRQALCDEAFLAGNLPPRFDEDPDDPATWEGSDAWWDARAQEEIHQREEADLWAAYADAYAAKGWPKYQRVTGGFVDLVTGELLPTPWRVTVEGGVVTLTRKESLP